MIDEKEVTFELLSAFCDGELTKSESENLKNLLSVTDNREILDQYNNLLNLKEKLKEITFVHNSTPESVQEKIRSVKPQIKIRQSTTPILKNKIIEFFSFGQISYGFASILAGLLLYPFLLGDLNNLSSEDSSLSVDDFTNYAYNDELRAPYVLYSSLESIISIIQNGQNINSNGIIEEGQPLQISVLTAELEGSIILYEIQNGERILLTEQQFSGLTNYTNLPQLTITDQSDIDMELELITENIELLYHLYFEIKDN